MATTFGGSTTSTNRGLALSPRSFGLLRRPQQTAAATSATSTVWNRTLGRVFGSSDLGAIFWDELEEALVVSDVGIQTTLQLVERVRGLVNDRGLTVAAEVKSVLRDEVNSIFADAMLRSPRVDVSQGKLILIMVGVNGAGKTTTIGKLAHVASSAGDDVLIAAGDTFRAGAIRQAEIWAERSGARCISTQPGGDPGAVVFDAMRAAHAGPTDLVIIDTAGRLHTSSNLMDELGKVVRIIDRESGDFEVRVLLVIDANSGQNGIIQAKEFGSAIALDGVVLTKLDSSARGGVAVTIACELGLPIWYVGIGESGGDIAEFDSNEFVRALLP